MKKMLLISHDFPPLHSVESVRSFKFAKYLLVFGLKSDVICGGQQEQSCFDGLDIHRTFSSENILLRVFELFTGLDSKLLWTPSAIKTGKRLLSKQKYSVILSRSTPISSHLVAYKLKLSNNVPWIADFSDPWTQNIYTRYPSRITKKIDEHLEKKVVYAADRIVFTSQRTKDLFLSKYVDIPESKVSVIPNFYDKTDFQNIKGSYNSDKCTFVHAGSFYKIRSPEPFFKALDLLTYEIDISNIHVKLVGNMKGFEHLIEKYGLENVVEMTGVVSREEANMHLNSADVLLLIDAPSDTPSVFLPTKLVDYIFMDKPILAITPVGTSADVVKATNTGTVVSPLDISSIKNRIKEYYERYQESNLTISPNFNEICRYTAQQCAKDMYEIIEELTQ